jgi:uncharacterized coiled-coil protein SlyX
MPTEKVTDEILATLETLAAAVAEERHQRELLGAQFAKLRSEITTMRTLANITERLARLESSGAAAKAAPLPLRAV